MGTQFLSSDLIVVNPFHWFEEPILALAYIIRAKQNKMLTVLTGYNIYNFSEEDICSYMSCSTILVYLGYKLWEYGN